jgi:hypothetical protein
VLDESWKPLEISPDDVDIPPGPAGLWQALDRLDVDGLLAGVMAMVFRGFGVTTDDLPEVIDRLVPQRKAYVHGNSPRSKVGSNLYTSTEYPPAYDISLHNELSYARTPPKRLMFFCASPPDSGGATPVVSGARWLAAIDPDVRAAFAGGVCYRQNLHDGYGFGRSWQQTFETSDRAEVDAYLADADVEWSWHDGTLRISQVRPATTRHEATGAEVWFNQADQWHTAGLPADTRAAITEIFPDEELPTSAEFADGGAIPPEYIAHIREAAWHNAVDVEWPAAGDILLVDNVLVGHGRRAFTGQRSILVAMT